MSTSPINPEECSEAWIIILGYFRNVQAAAGDLVAATMGLKDQISAAVAGDPGLVTPAMLTTVYNSQQAIEAELAKLVAQAKANSQLIIAASAAKYGSKP